MGPEAQRTFASQPSGRKFLLKLTYQCNNKCVFCHCNDKRGVRDALSLRAAGQRILMARRRGAVMIVLSGGEATVHPQFLTICRVVKEAELRLGLVSNGRLLSYPELTEGLLELGLEYLHISLHGSTAESHNRQVRAAAFEEVLEAIRRVAGRVPSLTVNCVVTSHNQNELGRLASLLEPFSPLELKYSLLFALGSAREDFKTLAPDPVTASQAVWDAIRFAQGRESRLKVTCDGFTPCLVPNEADFRSDLMKHGYVSMIETFEDDFYPVDEGARRFAARCSTCSARSSCLGIFAAYIEHFGDAYLRPDRLVVPSTVRYLRNEGLRPRPDADCVWGIGPISGDSSRHLVIREDGCFTRYHTDTDASGSMALARAKTTLGQVYLQEGNHETGIVPQRDLFKLNPTPECTECRHFGTCPAVYLRTGADVFAAFQDLLTARLSLASGRILEIGCGEEGVGRIVGWEMARLGRGDYLGVDPLAAAVQSGTFRVLADRLEQFKWEGDHFDHVWMFNTYNHLRDPESDLTRVLTYLKPGGEILWTDTTLALIARDGARNGGVRAIWEHYRNAESNDLVPWLTRSGCEVLEHYPVGPVTGNQWLIRARKSGA